MRTPALRIIFFWDTICPVVAVSGKWVKVMVAFSKVPEDAVGKVVRIDSDGDALIAFEGELGGEQWVSKHNLGNISVLSRRRVTKVTPPPLLPPPVSVLVAAARSRSSTHPPTQLKFILICEVQP